MGLAHSCFPGEQARRWKLVHLRAEEGGVDPAGKEIHRDFSGAACGILSTVWGKYRLLYVAAGDYGWRRQDFATDLMGNAQPNGQEERWL